MMLPLAQPFLRRYPNRPAGRITVSTLESSQVVRCQAIGTAEPTPWTQWRLLRPDSITLTCRRCVVRTAGSSLGKSKTQTGRRMSWRVGDSCSVAWSLAGERRGGTAPTIHERADRGQKTAVAFGRETEKGKHGAGGQPLCARCQQAEITHGVPVSIQNVQVVLQTRDSLKPPFCAPAHIPRGCSISFHLG